MKGSDRMANEQQKVRRLFLVRHGQPDFPGQKHYMYGHTDYPLSAKGEQQARLLGEALSTISFDHVVSSDLERARKTAQLILEQNQSPHSPLKQERSFREIYMGEWEGIEVTHIREKFDEMFLGKENDFLSARAPQGESFGELQARAKQAFARLLEESRSCENVLLVAHGGFFWALSCELFGLPMEQFFSFRQDYCGVHLVESWDKTLTLVSYNWSPMLGSTH